MHALLYAACGYVAGAFTPSIGRKIKAYFSKEATALEAKATSAASAEAKKL